jgi:hypothetical protein
MKSVDAGGEGVQGTSQLWACVDSVDYTSVSV